MKILFHSLCFIFESSQIMTMMRCELEFLPEIIEQARMLLSDYSESEIDESVRLKKTSFCRLTSFFNV